ncbi:MAG: four helix bundle protein [Patescibacteria group bacterium]|nr:four helix bundle protein [Patescibacteria group bacterium]MDD5294479.1 four helix bundle protein [Patescibacteria group bacterium]MDD5554405.1 four helix bundle protein [Patescibacteria group bacterium]
MKTFRFFDFPVYEQAKRCYKNILIISIRVQDYSFRDQIKRAALSVILNIAEGSAKKSDKDFAKFLEISVASANEVAACLDIMRDFKKISDKESEVLKEDLESIVKQLGGFIKNLRK